MRSHFANLRPARHAFTLLEMMLVLGLLVMVGALAWPSLQRAYDGIRLKKTAEQVMAAFGHARVQAMSTGVAQAFRFQPGTGQYTLMAMADDSGGVDSDASGAASAMAGSTARTSAPSSDSTSSSAGASAANSSDPNSPSASGGSSSSSSGSCGYQLNDGFVFVKGDRTADARSALTESQLPSDSSSSDAAPPVLFYPDGTASEAVVTISDKTGRSIPVSLRGLTGVARMGEVFTGEAPQ